MLLGAYTAWLSAPGRGEALRAAVPLLLGSLAVCEEGEPAGWPLRSKQEHAGVVALHKLATSVRVRGTEPEP